MYRIDLCRIYVGCAGRSIANASQRGKKNNLKGFKIVKMKIVNELQNELIKEIVIMSGGDVSKISHILDD
jgi:hypothetical protein